MDNWWTSGGASQCAWVRRFSTGDLEIYSRSRADLEPRAEQLAWALADRRDGCYLQVSRKECKFMGLFTSVFICPRSCQPLSRAARCLRAIGLDRFLVNLFGVHGAQDFEGAAQTCVNAHHPTGIVELAASSAPRIWLQVHGLPGTRTRPRPPDALGRRCPGHAVSGSHG